MTTSEKLIPGIGSVPKLTPWLTGLLLGILVLSIAGSCVFLILFQNRIYPGIKIDDVPIGGLTPAEAKQLLAQQLPKPTTRQVTLSVDDIKLASSSAELGLFREHNQSLAQAYEIGRVGFPLKRLWVLTKASFIPLEFHTQLEYDEAAVVSFVSEFEKLVNLVGDEPTAKLKYSGSPTSLVIDPGKPGREIVLNDTVRLVLTQVNSDQPIEARVASTSTVLNKEQITTAQERAGKLIGKRLILRADNTRLELNDQKLVSLLTFPEGFNQEIMDSLLKAWKDIVSRPAQNAEFEFNEKTLVVSKFIPHRKGLELDQDQTTQLIKNTLNDFNAKENIGNPIGIHNQSNIELELPVNTARPKIALSDTNNLGINEQIGFGESEYDHSIPNRIFNVSLTTNRISDVIVPPGKEFSFNKTLGEVSAKTGFRSAYVIKDGWTQLGDGGGVCQVSTTLFRAVLDAGLEITHRLPHSYRVSYYELNARPGIDATVYAGNIDLRFINDTNHHVLIRGTADNENLYMKMEIYGTDDGRTTEITDHEVWGYVSPPPPEYYPDPLLPAGVKKQVDWAVAGVKTKFTHVIKNAKGEITSEKTYHSNYLPWAAKYLVGE
ncbi:VanW family protein [Patescibacteria group bacterium]|nr:VanW family protein [Patescibacteria group bacterium]MBU1966840.1 VanW family protein [Patescibacteria group bacterium]MBU2543362.1 VanW family protein [Patescibacteria group bacterium]